MRAVRRRLVAAATVVGAGLLVLTGALPAVADTARPPKLMISTNGDEWATHLDAALFGDDLALVPGSSISSIFWVKNLSDGPAALSTRLIDVVTSSEAFGRSLSVSASTPAGDASGQGTSAATDTASPVSLTGDGCAPILAPLVLSPGAEVPVTVDLALADSAADDTANQTLDFTVLVTLTGLVGDAPAPAAGCAPGDPVGASTAGSDSSVRIDGLASATSGGTGRVPGTTRAGTSSAGTGAGESSGSDPSSGTGGSGVELPVHALGADDSFIAVALRDNWLPLLVGAVAVVGGVFVALSRRPDDDGLDGAEAGAVARGGAGAGAGAGEAVDR
ncbi:hypothetical protein ACPEEZ_09625 [Frigoribacterium sp. 2-23]|uniref:hypothetical protein n=1 Tax=Frigoribacterium sp. 2-23 TaxID=3415006 RepID=UPI003C6EAB34